MTGFGNLEGQALQLEPAEDRALGNFLENNLRTRIKLVMWPQRPVP